MMAIMVDLVTQPSPTCTNAPGPPDLRKHAFSQVTALSRSAGIALTCGNTYFPSSQTRGSASP